MSVRHGLKNHQVAQLVNRVTAELHAYCELPQMTRAIVSLAVLGYLTEQELLLDAPPACCHEDADA